MTGLRRCWGDFPARSLTAISPVTGGRLDSVRSVRAWHPILWEVLFQPLEGEGFRDVPGDDERAQAVAAVLRASVRDWHHFTHNMAHYHLCLANSKFKQLLEAPLVLCSGVASGNC